MLDRATLDAIFATKASRKRKPQGKGKAFVRGEDGLTSQVIMRMGDVNLGKFEGNVGSVKRSRKGRTYHAPNGRRFYNPLHESGDDQVVAYKLK